MSTEHRPYEEPNGDPTGDFNTEKTCFHKKKKVWLPVQWTFGQNVRVVIATDLRFSDLGHG